MATPGFELLFQNLQSIGFFEFGLPILFFMAVYYGLLMKTGTISDEESVNGTAAIALAFLTTLGIYTFIPFSIFPQFFAALAVLVVLVLGGMMLMGMLGVEVGGEMDERAQRLMVIGVVALLIIVGVPLFGSMDIGFELTDDFMNFILTIATIAVIGYVIRSMGGGE